MKGGKLFLFYPPSWTIILLVTVAQWLEHGHSKCFIVGCSIHPCYTVWQLSLSIWFLLAVMLVEIVKRNTKGTSFPIGILLVINSLVVLALFTGIILPEQREVRSSILLGYTVFWFQTGCPFVFLETGSNAGLWEEERQGWENSCYCLILSLARILLEPVAQWLERGHLNVSRSGVRFIPGSSFIVQVVQGRTLSLL